MQASERIRGYRDDVLVRLRPLFPEMTRIDLTERDGDSGEWREVVITLRLPLVGRSQSEEGVEGGPE